MNREYRTVLQKNSSITGKALAIVVSVLLVLSLSISAGLTFTQTAWADEETGQEATPQEVQSTEASLASDGVATVNGEGSYATIQSAIDAVTGVADPGTPTQYTVEIKSGTYGEALKFYQQANKNVVIKPAAGATVSLTGTMSLDGSGRLHNPETLTIQGITFDFSGKTASTDCITTVNTIAAGSHYSYLHNVTLDSCAFIGNNYNGDIVGIRVTSNQPGEGKNFSFVNCTTSGGMHSLAQFVGGTQGDIVLTGNTLRDTKCGINLFGSNQSVVFANNDFDVTTYGIRFGSGTGALGLTNSAVITDSVIHTSDAADGSIIFRGAAQKNISINGCEIVNSNPDGKVLQNIVAANAADFIFDLSGTYWGARGFVTAGEGSVVSGFDGNATLTTGTYLTHTTYDANGGSFADGSKATADATVTFGADGSTLTDFSFPADPANDGQTFLGWFAQAEDGDQVSAAGNAGFVGDATLYAHWEAAAPQPILAVSADNVVATYDGKPHTVAPKATADGVEVRADITYWNDKTQTYDLTAAPSFKDATSGAQTVRFRASYNGLAATGSATVTVNKADLTVRVSGNTDSVVENGSVQKVTGFTADNADKATVSLKSGVQAVAQGTDAGIYYMGLTAKSFTVDSKNYNVSLSVTDGKLVIMAKSIEQQIADLGENPTPEQVNEVVNNITNLNQETRDQMSTPESVQQIAHIEDLYVAANPNVEETQYAYDQTLVSGAFVSGAALSVPLTGEPLHAELVIGAADVPGEIPAGIDARNLIPLEISLNLVKKDGSHYETNVQPKAPITITMTVSDADGKLDVNNLRIVHYHEGTVEVIVPLSVERTGDDVTMTFTLASLSPVLLANADTGSTPDPGTPNPGTAPTPVGGNTGAAPTTQTNGTGNRLAKTSDALDGGVAFALSALAAGAAATLVLARRKNASDR